MASSRNHHLVLRGDTWYFVTKVNGKRIKKALSKSLTEARRLRDEYIREIKLHGGIPQSPSSQDGPLFGEVAARWARVTEKRVKMSTMIDYRSAMNTYVLPRFGNTPIGSITYVDVEEMLADMECSAKRMNNVMVPMRGVFNLAYKSGYVDKNVMRMIENRKVVKPQIHPLSITEVAAFLEAVNPFYRPFFEVAFFTGMRGGEMAALKWDNVDLEKRTITVAETRVYGEEGRPKTSSSYRTIKMLPMVHRALLAQATRTRFKSGYVFLNLEGHPIDVETLRKTAWTAGLKSAKLPYRPMIQTRHTFATLMISAGENIGWVQRSMGHASLKMIMDKYFAYIPDMTHQDGSLFVEEFARRIAESTPKVPQASGAI
jgi:integrase